MKKNYRNDGKSYDDALQNKFTAYMDKALRNNMINLLERSLKYKVSEDFVSIEETQEMCDISAEEEVIGGATLDFELDYIENIALLKALRKISPKDMTIIKLRLLYEYRFSRIAFILGMNENAVRVRYFRSIKAIRKFMEGK